MYEAQPIRFGSGRLFTCLAADAVLSCRFASHHASVTCRHLRGKKPQKPDRQGPAPNSFLFPARRRRFAGASVPRNRLFMFVPFVGTFSTDLAIDLGTANTLIFAATRASCSTSRRSSPSATKGGPHGKKVIQAVGAAEAKAMLGKVPGNIEAIRLMKDGVIADFTSPSR